MVQPRLASNHNGPFYSCLFFLSSKNAEKKLVDQLQNLKCMCYLLIGNISALISDDHVEPLAQARIRVYLPDGRYPIGYNPKKNVFNGPGQLSSTEISAKRGRLLAEVRLDERGNFTMGWEQLHLFTEPLELDICLDGMPEQRRGAERHYHLGTLTPHWKYSGQRYVAAYAYVVPAESWNTMRAIYGTGVSAGTIKSNYTTIGTITM